MKLTYKERKLILQLLDERINFEYELNKKLQEAKIK